MERARATRPSDRKDELVQVVLPVHDWKVESIDGRLQLRPESKRLPRAHGSMARSVLLWNRDVAPKAGFLRGNGRQGSVIRTGMEEMPNRYL